ncbi:MAG: hypothetical protein KFB93_03255 [Simkaniaceae bacterium]|nr:MAG: hypothetical protein KFB93_03255 [Simkaniaceae bacterium]
MDPLTSKKTTNPPFTPLEEEGSGFDPTSLTADEFEQQLMQAVEENPNTTDKTRELAKELVKFRREVDDSVKLSDEVSKTIEESKALLARSKQIVEERERQTAELQQEVNMLQLALTGISYALSFFTTQDN